MRKKEPRLGSVPLAGIGGIPGCRISSERRCGPTARDYGICHHHGAPAKEPHGAPGALPFSLARRPSSTARPPRASFRSPLTTALNAGTSARRRAGASYAAAALFVHKAALDIPSPPEAIAKAFKLTPTELRVLLAIVEVGGVPEVAETLGIAETVVAATKSPAEWRGWLDGQKLGQAALTSIRRPSHLVSRGSPQALGRWGWSGGIRTRAADRAASPCLHSSPRWFVVERFHRLGVKVGRHGGSFTLQEYGNPAVSRCSGVFRD